MSGKKEKTPKKHAHEESTTVETRTRKKAREAIDLITGTAQRNESLINFLGSDYKDEEYKGPSDAELKMMFRVFDRDNDGHIGSDELADVLRSMGKRPLTKKIQKMLDECDVNKNGTIELKEFVEFMKKKAAKKAEALRNKGKKKDDDKEEVKEEKKEDTKKEKEEKKDEEEEEEEAPAKGKKRKAASGKKASPKKAAKKGKKAAAAPEPEPEATTTGAAGGAGGKLIHRASSILDFYTAHAGLQEADPNAKLDKYENPEGPEFDLGVEGAFKTYKILAGLFYDAKHDSAATTMTPADFRNRVGAALASKGFDFEVVTTQKEFVAKLADYSVAWIISNLDFDTTTTEAEFVDAVEKYHQSGGGLFLFADNDPWHKHANAVLKRLYKVEVGGCTPAEKTITVGDATKAGHFAKHLITSGIKNLFEGRTVSYPKDQVPDSLAVLAQSTDNHPVILYSTGKDSSPTAGRVVLDCGFTKLWVQWDSAGTERYVKNASVWLVGIDARLAANAPLAGVIAPKKKEEQPVWQYHHGTWHNYDKDASDLVEAAYQDWKANPYTDVRSVKSGHWHYMVDFRQMKQTNIEHTAHTQRDVKRVVREVFA